MYTANLTVSHLSLINHSVMYALTASALTLRQINLVMGIPEWVQITATYHWQKHA